MESVKPPGPDKPKTERARSGRTTRAMYEALAQTYLHGNRTWTELHRKHKVSARTAKKAIYDGWPEHKWPALKDRAELFDRQREEMEKNSDPQRAQQARDFLQMRDEYMRIAFGVRAALAQGLSKLVPEIKNAVATTTKAVRQVHFEEVLDAAGKVTRRIPRTITVDVVVAPSIYDVMSSVSQIASALERTGGGELEQLLANPPPSEITNKKHKLTWEQIEFMAANGGKLPEGVTLDDLGEM